MTNEVISAIGLIDQSEFLRLLQERLPKVAESLDPDYLDLLHLVMASVADATSKAINAESWSEVSLHFEFIEQVFLNSDPSVENAVYVSYLENAFLGESGSKHLHARSLLPHKLAHALSELEAHFDRLAKGAGST